MALSFLKVDLESGPITCDCSKHHKNVLTENAQ